MPALDPFHGVSRNHLPAINLMAPVCSHVSVFCAGVKLRRPASFLSYEMKMGHFVPQIILLFIISPTFSSAAAINKEENQGNYASNTIFTYKIYILV